MVRHQVFYSLALLALANPLLSQEKANPPSEPKSEAKSQAKSAMPDQAALFKKFSETMSGAKLVGNFTVDGMAIDKLIKEEYHVISAEKMPNGDFWLITARVKYGKNDITLPMPLEVKWAGKTPVITLDEVTIPGLGTFDAKVVIDGKRYAGTWQHGKFGGLLFGAIERDEPKKEEEKTAEKKEEEPKKEEPKKDPDGKLPSPPTREGSDTAPSGSAPPAKKLDPLPPPPTRNADGTASPK